VPLESGIIQKFLLVVLMEEADEMVALPSAQENCSPRPSTSGADEQIVNCQSSVVNRMNWKLPNQLTVARIGLAGLFFLLLGLYGDGGRWVSADGKPIFDDKMLLNAAFGVYILAGITDVLDGYFARKWNLTSAFGRIADPFVDKVLVIGAFVMLAGQNFLLGMATPILPMPLAGAPGNFEHSLPHWLTGGMSSAVQAWMVVVILARELLVSAVRGYSESQGVKFPATQAGKIKMLVQSVAICTVLFQLANVPDVPWAVIVKVSVVWLAVVATVISGLCYVGQIRQAMRVDDQFS